MKNTAIFANEVAFSYDKENKILDKISFEANQGESIGLIGANGVGKSTLLKILTGLVLNFSGEVKIGGLTVEKKNLSAIREKIGYVFQDSDSQLFMSTVYGDVAFAPRNYGLSGGEVNNRVMEALSRVNIQHLKDKQIYKLSGGEKKIVSIATILAMTPEIILMDEPSIALDPKNRRNLINILNGFRQLKVIASHDLDMILDTCRRTILLSEGKVLADGDTEKILSDKKLLEEAGLELPLCMQKRK